MDCCLPAVRTRQCEDSVASAAQHGRQRQPATEARTAARFFRFGRGIRRQLTESAHDVARTAAMRCVGSPDLAHGVQLMACFETPNLGILSGSFVQNVVPITVLCSDLLGNDASGMVYASKTGVLQRT